MKNNSIGSSWEDVRSELFTEEEISESDMRVALVVDIYGRLIDVFAVSALHPLFVVPLVPSQWEKCL